MVFVHSVFLVNGKPDISTTTQDFDDISTI